MNNFDRTSLLLSIKALDNGEVLLKRSHLYNALSLLHLSLPHNNWVGLYQYEGKLGKLILGPFGGSPACEVIDVGKGVVGTCYAKKIMIVVPDVTAFPGYICCDPLAMAELVVPLCQNGKVIGVLDVDYPKNRSFEGEEGFYQEAAKILEGFI